MELGYYYCVKKFVDKYLNVIYLTKYAREHSKMTIKLTLVGYKIISILTHIYFHGKIKLKKL